MKITGLVDGSANEIVGEPQQTKNCSVTFYGKNGKLIIHERVRLLGANLHIHDDATIEIGAKTLYRGTLRAHVGCTIKLGEAVHCNSHLTISSAEETNVTVGDRCLVSAAVIRPSDMHAIYDRTTGQRVNFGRDVVIGNDVWLAQDCFILKGVTIGEGCAIAARAVVTRDIPPHCIAAGNPARVVRENITWGGDFPLRPRTEGLVK